MLKKISEQWSMEFPKIKNLKVHEISSDAQIIVGNGIKILKIAVYSDLIHLTIRKFQKYLKGL